MRRCGECLTRLREPRHQSEVEGPFCWNGLAGQDRLHGSSLADGAGESEETTCSRDQIPFHLSEPERGLGGRDHEVCGQHDLATAGSGQPIDGHDDRLAAFAIDESSESAALGVQSRGVTGIDGFEISACAEDRARLPVGVGLKDPDPDVIVGFELVDRRFEALSHVAVDRIACVGTIEGDPAYDVRWRWPVVAGVAVWLIGLMFEAVGDAQLAAYKRLPQDERPAIMETGLWRYTRHPNYFGDACVWWGIWLAGALSVGWLPGVLTLVAPVAMTYFLAFATGARLLERTMMQRPGYPEYAARTSMLFPLPPRGRPTVPPSG